MTTPNQPQYAAPTPRPASAFYLKAADGLVALGGLIVFFFSFAPLFAASVSDADLAEARQLGITIPSTSENSWHEGITIFVALAGLILAGIAFLDSIWRRERQLQGLHRHVVQVGIALFVLVDLIGLGLSAPDGAHFSWGGYFQMVGALVAVAGAVLNHYGRMQNLIALPQGGGSAAPSGYPGYQAPTQAYPAQGGAQAPSDPQSPTQAG